MQKVMILDVYPENSNKSCKDTGGGYGTSHDYGDSFFSSFIRLLVRKNVSFPPLYLPYVITHLENQGLEVNVEMNYHEEYSADYFIVISSIIAHELEIELIKALKKRTDKILVLGAFARFNSQLYENAGAKVLKSEPEIYLNSHSFISLFEGVETHQTQTFNNQLTLPKPKWDKLIELYQCKLGFLSFKKVVPIALSKGCPFSCSVYCTYPLEQGSKVRVRDIDEVCNEITYIKDEYGIDNFLFRDPVFTMNRAKVFEFCESIIQSGIKIQFAMETHLKLLDEELIQVMSRAGLRLIYVGVESSSDEVCEEQGRYTIEHSKQVEMIKLLEKYKVNVKIMYIIGFPSEHKKDYELNKKLAKKFNPLYIQLNIFTPYPGTQVYDSLKNQVTSERLMDFNQSNLVFAHKNYTKEEVRKMISEFYIDFYIRFGWFIKFISSTIRRIKDGLYGRS